MSRICSGCGASAQLDAQYCAACGVMLAPAAAPVAEAHEPPATKGTAPQRDRAIFRALDRVSAGLDRVIAWCNAYQAWYDARQASDMRLKWLIPRKIDPSAVQRNHDGIKCDLCKKRGADQRGPARRQRKPWPAMGEQWWVATFVCRNCGARQTLEVKR